MTKLPDKSALVLFVVVLVALVGLSASFFSSGITGDFNFQTQEGLVRYVSCHYKDFDKFGECMRIERQEGRECNPPETVPKTYTREPFEITTHETGQFWRPCYNGRKF